MWISHRSSPFLETRRWFPITLGNTAKAEVFPHTIKHPATSPVSPYRSPPSLHPNHTFLPRTCQACCRLGASVLPVPLPGCTFCAFLLYLIWVSALLRDLLTTSFKVSSLTHLSWAPYPALFIFLAFTIPWHSVAIGFLACGCLPAVEWKLQRDGIWFTAAAQPLTLCLVHCRSQAQVKGTGSRADGPGLKLSFPPTGCEILHKALNLLSPVQWG